MKFLLTLALLLITFSGFAQIHAEHYQIMYWGFAYSQPDTRTPHRANSLLIYDVMVYPDNTGEVISFSLEVPGPTGKYEAIWLGKQNPNKSSRVLLNKFDLWYEDIYMLGSGVIDMNFLFEEQNIWRPVRVKIPKEQQYYSIHTFGEGETDKLKYYCNFLNSTLIKTK